MNSRTIPTLILILVLLASISYGEESVWFVNGKRAADTENVKSKDGFSAQLWVIRDFDNFFKQWNSPETPYANLANHVKRNERISTLLVFMNPGINEKNQCDVVYDIVITAPDRTTVVMKQKDLNAWQDGIPAPQPDMLQVSPRNLVVKFEDNDPVGKYTVDAIVKDKVKNIEISLHKEFTVE